MCDGVNAGPFSLSQPLLGFGSNAYGNHRPSEIPVLIWHQGCVLPKVGFLSQVLDHGDGSVIQRYTSFAGGRFQLANLHITARFSLQAIPAPHFFHSPLKVEDSPLQVDVAVEESQQFARPQTCVQHEV